MDLFDQAQSQNSKFRPLADRMRPATLDEIVGQEHLLGPGKVLRQSLERDQVPSMILWGPPGSGKTTLAMLIASYTGAHFVAYSAVTSGVKELREVVAEAKDRLKHNQRKTILFIDEIHRFNKAQQDAFLPFVEHGVIILIGATTENPSFEVNSALLSRCRVFVLKGLAREQVLAILRHTLEDKDRGLAESGLNAEPEALDFLAEAAHGDARAALNTLELAANLAEAAPEAKHVTLAIAQEAAQQKVLRYDRAGDEHYNIISALHKSVRGSDPDAALYWLGRMLEAGEDPHFLLRRMARMAAEDIGLADPNALWLASAARQTFDFIGLPEGNLILAELAVYLSLAPKSNALETGFMEVQAAVRRHGELEVPLHIRNAPTKLMRNLGYGKDYRYAHDYEGHWVPEDYLPQELLDQQFYKPGNFGWEGKRLPEIADRRKRREAARKQKGERPQAKE